MNYYVPIQQDEACKRYLFSQTSPSTSSKPRYTYLVPRILMRKYSLTSTAYKFLDIGIVVGPISHVQIAAMPEIDKVHDIVLTDRRVKVREFVEATGISRGTVISILHEQLDMKKLSARWVPHEFLRRFVTVDETWIHYFTHGIIHIDYLSSKQTINGDYLLDRFKILKKKCPCLAKRKVLFHQDNARVHTCPAPMAKFNELLSHPGYSPDLAPCDYFLFPNLKKWFGGKKFTTRE
ncbi:SETMR methyltransferase, partial [Acromyrmex charruanus]